MQDQLTQAKARDVQLSEELSSSQATWQEKETALMEERGRLEERVRDLTEQNKLLHGEAEKVSKMAHCIISVPPSIPPSIPTSLPSLPP